MHVKRPANIPANAGSAAGHARGVKRAPVRAARVIALAAFLAAPLLSAAAGETNHPAFPAMVQSLLAAQGAFMAARHQTAGLAPDLRAGFKAQDAKALELAAALPAAGLAALSAGAEQRAAWALACAFRSESAALVSGAPVPLPDLAPELPPDFLEQAGAGFSMDATDMITDRPEAWASPSSWGKPSRPPEFSGWVFEGNAASFTNTASPLVRSDIILDDAELTGELRALEGEVLLLILRSGIVVKFQPGPVPAAAGNVNVKFGYDNLRASSLYGKAQPIEPGEWYAFSASISGQCLRVALEGRDAINARIADDPRLPASRLPGAGAFGLGGHKSSGAFRNIRIKALSPQGRMRLQSLPPPPCYAPDGPATDFLAGGTNDFVSLAHQSVEPHKPASHAISNGVLAIRGAPYAQFARRNLAANHYRVDGRARLLEEGGAWFRANHRLLFGVLSAPQGPPFAVKHSTGGFQRWDEEWPGSPIPAGEWFEWELEYHDPYGILRVNKRPVMMATGAFARTGNERVVNQFGISAYNTAAEFADIRFQRLAPGGIKGREAASLASAWYKAGFAALNRARAEMTNHPAPPGETLAMNILEGRQAPVCASLDDFRAAAGVLRARKDFPGLLAFLEDAAAAIPAGSAMQADIENDRKAAALNYENAMKSTPAGEVGPDGILRTGDKPAHLLPAHDGVHVWLALREPGRALRLNPATAAVTHSAALKDELLMPAARRDYWIGVSADDRRTLLKVDPMTGATAMSNTLEKGSISSLAQHPFQPLTYVAVNENSDPETMDFDRCRIYILNESDMTLSAKDWIGEFLSADPAGRYLYAGFSVALSPKLSIDPSFLRIEARRGFVDHLLRYRIAPDGLRLDAQMPAPGAGGFDIKADPSGSMVFHLSVLGCIGYQPGLQQQGAVAGFRTMRWDKPRVTFEAGSAATAMAFSRDGRRAFLGVGRQIRVYDMETGDLIVSSLLPAAATAVRQLMLAPDGATLLASFAGKPSGVFLHRIPAAALHAKAESAQAGPDAGADIAGEQPWTTQGNQAARRLVEPLLTALSTPELENWADCAMPSEDLPDPPAPGDALRASNRWRLPAADPAWETDAGFQDAADDLASFLHLAEEHPWSWLRMWAGANRAYPDSARLHLELALRLERMALDGLAIGAGQKTVELCGGEGLLAFRAWLLLGRLHGRQGNAPRQVAAFQEAIRLCPGDSYVHFRLGLALAAAGFPNRGAGHLLTAYQIFPGRPGLEKELAGLGITVKSNQPPLDTSALFRRAAPAVVIISRADGNGTGFLVARNGILLTNHHVVEDAGGLAVQFRDLESGTETSLKCSIVACDSIRDIALLSVDAVPPALAPIELADSDMVRTGDPIVVIGNPGIGVKVLSHTATEGIVSGKNRKFGDRDFFQISAAVNPGNSGGPMLLRSGRAAGMVTLKARLENVGFAVPANDLLDFIEGLESQ